MAASSVSRALAALESNGLTRGATIISPARNVAALAREIGNEALAAEAEQYGDALILLRDGHVQGALEDDSRTPGA